MPITKDELRDLIDELETHKGRATELITVYIPEGQNIYTVADQLEAEKSTAKNIKSTSTRKNVGNALDKITRYLKDYKKTPENGLALFAGNISKIEGQDDLQLWDIEPPMPLKTRMYRCDKDFILEPLREMLAISEIHGLLVMDRKEATIGILEGKRIEVMQKMSSGVPSKVRAGGQSSQRFHRITEGLTRDFYKRIAAEMKNIFYDNPKLKGILIGGPIPTKDEFIDGQYLATRLQEKVIGKIDIGGSDESGLKELVTRSQDILFDQEIVREQKLLEKFFETLGQRPDMATFKEDTTRKALEYGAVDLLILSKSLNRNLIRELTKLAENINSRVEMVSTDTEEGQQFANLSGIGAILRFKI
ncbi:MAG TPA: peptide chain release factor aRF-1 [Candidatus Nanoarchaeia archaeon]|nr:peptide chain release factor aRF-1 [Candidatus Nanoarchaeia archaeon]